MSKLAQQVQKMSDELQTNKSAGEPAKPKAKRAVAPKPATARKRERTPEQIEVHREAVRASIKAWWAKRKAAKA